VPRRWCTRECIMIIQDVVSLAKYSELSGVAVKNDINAITAFINLGLLELYKRFPIKVEEHLVSLVDGSYYYEMPTNFMYALEAFGEIPEGSEEKSVSIPINDEDNVASIMFVDWNTVQIPSAITGGHVSIVYVAKPNRVTATQAEDGVTELDLPDTLLEALLSYVGYRGHLGVKGDSQSENNAHLQRFERSCLKVEELGIGSPADSMSMDERIGTKGFV
jgi:hypothetical protein